jgi:hypothetical protein
VRGVVWCEMAFCAAHLRYPTLLLSERDMFLGLVFGMLCMLLEAG